MRRSRKAVPAVTAADLPTLLLARYSAVIATGNRGNRSRATRSHVITPIKYVSRGREGRTLCGWPYSELELYDGDGSIERLGDREPTCVDCLRRLRKLRAAAAGADA